MESVRAKLDRTGRLLIPSRFRKELGVMPGAEVIVGCEDGELHIYTQRQALRKIQAWCAQFKKPGVSVVDEFLAERREEAKRELEEIDGH